jgi:hypothetical protein
LKRKDLKNTLTGFLSFWFSTPRFPATLEEPGLDLFGSFCKLPAEVGERGWKRADLQALRRLKPAASNRRHRLTGSGTG